MSKFVSIVTEKGSKLIAQAVFSKSKVKITHFAVGDGAGSYYFPDATMTRLKNEVWRGGISSVNIDGSNKKTTAVRAIVPPDNGGFIIREMALFDDEGNMIVLANTAEIEKPDALSGCAVSLSVGMHVKLSETEADALNIIINPEMFAHAEDILKLGDELKAKAPIDSPAFTGVPTAPTPDDNSDEETVVNIGYLNNHFSANSGKKYSTVVVGTADAGYTAKDVDILVPAGSSNCIDQLNEALDTVPTDGGEILLLAGVYTYGSPWVIERDNVAVRGLGTSTVLNMNGTRTKNSLYDKNYEIWAKSNNSVIYLSGNNNRITYVRFVTPDSDGNSYGVSFENASYNTVTECIFENISGNDNSFPDKEKRLCVGVFLMGGTENNSITSNIFKNIGNGCNSYGFLSVDSPNSTISKNKFNVYGSYDITAVLVSGSVLSFNTVVSDNIINITSDGGGFGIICMGSKAHIKENIINITAKGVCRGISVNQLNSIVSGNTITLNGGDETSGVIISTYISYLISMNIIDITSDSKCYGVHFTPTNSDRSRHNGTISGNVIKFKSTAKTATGISLEEGSSSAIIGNVLSCEDDNKNGVKYGIFSYGSNNIIMGNEFRSKSVEFNGFSFQFYSGFNYNQVLNNNLRNWIAFGSGALTNDGIKSSSLPGSATTAAAFSSAYGTGSVAGFNIV